MKYNYFIETLETYVNYKKGLAIIKYRDKKIADQVIGMLNNKFDHTKNVVSFVVKLANKLALNIDFEKIVAASGLFHDIGRFNQALKFRSFNDSQVFRNNENHGDYGFNLLTTECLEMEIFHKIVPEKNRAAVATTVKLHQRDILPHNFNQHISEELRKTELDSILTGSYEFNDLEEQIVSIMLQMVRDVDRIDILNQRANGSINSISDNIYLNNTGNVSSLAKRWGVKESVIYDNNDQERLSGNSQIVIPREYIPIEKLFVNKDLINKMRKFENINLRDLQQQEDYTFITALWWSIYTFLKDMNFVGDLKIVKELDLLDQIYNRYPIEYRPLIDEIFTFANNVLIDEQISINKKDIYVDHILQKKLVK